MNDFKANITNANSWWRLFFMLVVGFFLWLAFWIICVLVVVQFGFSIFQGSDNKNVRSASNVISKFVKQAVDFLTYNSDVRPFPFSDLPSADEQETPYASREEGGSMEPNIAVAPEGSEDELVERSVDTSDQDSSKQS